MTVPLLAAVAALLALVAALMWFGFRRRPASVAARADTLLAQAEGAHRAGRLAAADRGYRRVADALGKPGAPTGLAATRGRALVGLGEVAGRQGHSADALAAFRAAFALTTLPPGALELTAADATRRADPGPLEVALCVDLVTRTDTDPDHAAYDFLEARCVVAAGASEAELIAVEALAARIEAGAPRLEWAVYGRACALRDLGRGAEAIAAFERADRLVPRAATGYELGRLHRDAGRPDEALAAFERSLTIEPERPEVLYAMALTHLRRKPADKAQRVAALEAAVGLLTRTCTLAPTHAQAWLGLGRAQHALGHDDAAFEPLRRACELMPEHVDVQMEFVDLALARGQRAAAIPVLRRVVAGRPRHVAANLILGTLHDEDGDFVAAAPCFERVVAVEPGHARARFGLGRALFEQGEAGRAIPHLAAVPERDAAQHHLLARAYSAAGEPAAADAAFSAAIEAGDDSAIAHHRQACVRLRRELRQDAIASFWRVLDRADDDSPLAAEALLFRGITYREEGDLGAARADADAAVAAAPRDARAHYARGQLAVLEDEWATARGAFETAVRLDPDYAPARFGLGLVREHAGEHEGAAEAYEHGLARRADWTPAVVRLGAARIAAGRLADGIEVLGRVRGEPTGSARFHLALGYARQGRVERADELWAAPGGVNDAIRAHNVATARDLLARAALAAGDHPLAREHWQACRDAFPEHDGYRTALAETLFREGAELLRFGRDGGARLAAARDRLGAAVALVPGDRRVRLHLAVAALYAGEPALAVRLSAALDPLADPRVGHLAPLARLALGAGTVSLGALVEAEPAAWAVRGMHAARGRRWADAAEAYRQALVVPGPVEPEPRAAVCEAAECTASARAGCGQCGRAYCAEHGVLVAALPARCGSCVDAVLAALASCAHLAGTGPAAEAEATRWAGDGGRAAAHHLLALLRAQRGDHDAALAGLERLLAGPMASDEGRLIAARVYLHRAAAHSADLVAASADVERAARLVPELPEVRRARPLLRSWQALAHALAGRHEASIEIRLESERIDPTDVRNLQCLALSALRAGQAGDAGHTTGMWRLVCGTWATVLYTPRFWIDLEARTGREISAEQIHTARQEQIERVYRELRERAAHSEGSVAALYRRLDRHWAWEVAATERVAALDPAPAPIVCGPLFLARVTDSEQGSDAGLALAEAVRAAADPHTGDLLGPLGMYHHLIDVGRFDEAVAGLTGLAGLAGPDATPGVAALLARAHLARARDLGGRGEWAQALGCLEQAAPIPAEATELAAEVGIRAAEAVLAADPAEEDEAARLLQRAWALAPDGPGLRGELAGAYARLARRAHEGRRHRDAIALVRQALELTPADPATRALAGAALRGLVMELLAADTDAAAAEAVGAMREAFALDPGEASRIGLTNALFLSAERLALRGGAREQAVAAMAEAIALADPDGETDSVAAEARRRVAALLVETAGASERDEDFDRAITLLEEARHYGDDPPTRRALAFNHYYARHYEVAEKLLRQEIGGGLEIDALREAWVVVAVDWGYDLLAKGRAYDAIEVLSAALREHEEPRLRDALVAVYLGEERYQDAIRTLEAIELTPENTRLLALALHNEGVRQANMGHNHTALVHLERAHEYHPTEGTREILDEVRSRIHGYY
ncbi:tetratricopeptide repeat protein [Embleya hyalina]|uniref:Beta-barrel assembly-enhancing protease n=1 Tax=Embleya hyalina TaxID=516124 RepID=A0A401YXU6_9ACTN|nr:tetratricopeptide repeat protein [Embleya hyalina]GCD99421.1 beta-barrel assembly-enhancing protease [Embleya hyalina]